jgi:hypothetical protein
MSILRWRRNDIERPPYQEPEPESLEDKATALARELGFPGQADAQFYIALFDEIKSLRARIAKLEEKE